MVSTSIDSETNNWNSTEFLTTQNQSHSLTTKVTSFTIAGVNGLLVILVAGSVVVLIVGCISVTAVVKALHPNKKGNDVPSSRVNEIGLVRVRSASSGAHPENSK